MAFTEFCCRSGGNNLNAGTRTGNSTEPGTSAAFTYDGTFATNTFTVTGANPQTDGVAAGDYVQVSDNSAIGRIARVSSVTSSTIVLSATNTVTVNAGTYVKARVGGAWAGPSGSATFPVSTGSMYLLQNSSANPVRINFKNDQTYSMTSALSTGAVFGSTMEGYTTSYGDGGRATIDGGSSTIVLLTINQYAEAIGFICQNNGASGSNTGILVAMGGTALRCVANTVRGIGIDVTGVASECEAYACNSSNTASLGGFRVNAAGFVDRCISHDNTAGSNCHGFYVATATAPSFLLNCISDTNAGDGVRLTANGSVYLSGLDIYSNTGDGINANFQLVSGVIKNSNLVKNGAYGIRGYASTAPIGLLLYNNGYGAGTMANSGGATTGAALQESGAVNYASDVTPWTDPANGDFRINLATAKGAGRGTFTQTASSYAGSVAYPDIGAVQHLDAGGGGGPLTDSRLVR